MAYPFSRAHARTVDVLAGRVLLLREGARLPVVRLRGVRALPVRDLVAAVEEALPALPVDDVTLRESAATSRVTL
jgi:hypothetical protein